MKEKTLDWRKVLSLLLIVALVLQISPVQAFAVGQDESVIEQTETIAAATEEPAPEATVIGVSAGYKLKKLPPEEAEQPEWEQPVSYTDTFED